MSFKDKAEREEKEFKSQKKYKIYGTRKNISEMNV